MGVCPPKGGNAPSKWGEGKYGDPLTVAIVYFALTPPNGSRVPDAPPTLAEARITILHTKIELLFTPYPLYFFKLYIAS